MGLLKLVKLKCEGLCLFSFDTKLLSETIVFDSKSVSVTATEVFLQFFEGESVLSDFGL